MEDASHLDSSVSMRIASILSRHQQAVRLVTVLVEFRSVVMAIPQYETDFCGNFSQESRGRVTVRHIGRSQHRSERKPDGTDYGDHVQFPAIDESTASRTWSNGLRYQSRYGELPLSRGPSDARHRRGRVARYYRWRPHAPGFPRAGSGRADGDPDSQSVPVSFRG